MCIFRTQNFQISEMQMQMQMHALTNPVASELSSELYKRTAFHQYSCVFSQFSDACFLMLPGPDVSDSEATPLVFCNLMHCAHKNGYVFSSSTKRKVNVQSRPSLNLRRLRHECSRADKYLVSILTRPRDPPQLM